MLLRASRIAEVFLLSVLAFGLNTSAARGEEMTLSAFAELDQQEQIDVLRDGVDRIHAVARDKMVEASCSIRERARIPFNYGQSSPTEGLKWGPDHRNIKYQMRYDGVCGWDRTITKATSINSRRESGQNGTKVIFVSKVGDEPISATINCNDPFQFDMVPDQMYAHPLRLLYFDSEHDSTNSYLNQALENATTIDSETMFAGQQAVAVEAPRQPYGTKTVYFAIEPLILCLGIELDQDPESGDPTDRSVFRIGYVYRDQGNTRVLQRATRSVFNVKPDGSLANVMSHVEIEFDRLRFLPKLEPDEYLPKIPDGIEVRDNCAEQAEAEMADASDEAEGSLLWLYVVLGVLVVTGVAGVFTWRHYRA